VAAAPNKQLQRTVTRRRVRRASASFHCALAPRWLAQRAAADLRRWPAQVESEVPKQQGSPCFHSTRCWRRAALRGDAQVRLFVLAACSVFAIVGTEVVAQPRQNCTGPQLGTWKLQSYTVKDLATGQTTDIFGARPSGYISYGSDCRMSAILIQEDRKAPASLVATEAERIDLYGGLIAYAGSYSIEGDKVSHHIDASWNQAWTGTTQVRQFRIDGKTLYITAMASKHALTGRETSSALTWTKVE